MDSKHENVHLSYSLMTGLMTADEKSGGTADSQPRTELSRIGSHSQPAPSGSRAAELPSHAPVDRGSNGDADSLRDSSEILVQPL